MIVAGLVLLAVGGGDIVRRHVPRRQWLAYTVAGLVLVVAAAALDATAAAILALLAAAGWLLTVRSDGAARAGLWAAALLAVLCAVAVILVPPRPLAGGAPGLLSGAPLDVVVTALGAAVFLTESGNVLVRSALRREHAVSPEASGLKGGRLIGPLERLLVFALTLAGAYTLLAAVLAAKGIVRFPEISRDGETGERAEYFLIGSLVSWTAGLAAALLVWWGTIA
ncbi:hypothetical protein ACIQLJ_16580 [Microbacterium sp. NPDC091313]